jgi:hypothetical protein
MGWATFWAIFSKTHLVALQPSNRRKFAQSGTDVMIFKIFLPKHLAKNWRF